MIGLIEMEDADRAKLLGMSDAKLEAVAKWCNRYPDIDLKFDIDDKDDIATGDAVTVLVQLERDFDGELPPVQSVASSPHPTSLSPTSITAEVETWNHVRSCFVRARVRRDTSNYCPLSGFPCPTSHHRGASARLHRLLTHDARRAVDKSRCG